MRAVRPALEKGLKATLTVVRYFVIMVGWLVGLLALTVGCRGRGGVGFHIMVWWGGFGWLVD